MAARVTNWYTRVSVLAGGWGRLAAIGAALDEIVGDVCIAGLPFNAFQQELRTEWSAGSRNLQGPDCRRDCLLNFLDVACLATWTHATPGRCINNEGPIKRLMTDPLSATSSKSCNIPLLIGSACDPNGAGVRISLVTGVEFRS